MASPIRRNTGGNAQRSPGGNGRSGDGHNGSPSVASMSALAVRASVEAQFATLESALVSRAGFANRAGLTYPTGKIASTGYSRDMSFTLGYKDSIDISDYRARYQRGGLANRIVEAQPRATWSGGASIVEDPAPDAITPFEVEVVDLFDRHDIWARLLRADILAGLGRYSVLLIGADGEPDTEMGQLSAEGGVGGVLYLRPIAEDRITIDRFVTAQDDPRFGLPEVYKVRLGSSLASDSMTHFSRVIHVAESLLDNDVYGKPRLESVWNYLDDLAKVVGGGAEAAWKRADPGMQIDLDPKTEYDADTQTALQDQIDEYVHKLRRVIRTRGAKINLLQSTVANFGDNADSILQLISATTGIPHRILTGSERGELASTQDRNNWNDRISERRREFAVPLVRRLIDRLIEHSALPEPTDPYEVVWPEIDELNEAEKAEVVVSFSRANQAQVAAGGGVVLTEDEIRDRVLGLGPLDEVLGDGETGDVGGEGNGIPGALHRLRVAKSRRYRTNADTADIDADEPEWRNVHRIADRHRPRLARVFLSVWVSMAAAVDADTFITAAERGDWQRARGEVASAISRIEQEFGQTLPDHLLSILVDSGEAAAAAANARGSWFRAAATVTRSPTPAAPVPVPVALAHLGASFNAANPEAAIWAALRSSNLITEVTQETRAGVRVMIEAGIREGIPPRQLLKQIKQVIGLRSDQVAALVKFREGGATTKQVAAYARRLHRQRALLIARTETIHAANEGQRQLWLQSQESGNLPKDVKRVWISTLDRRTRPAHRIMNGQVTGIDEPFTLPDGRRLMNPSEPNCILPGVEVSGRFVAGLKARYTGPALSIKTASVYRLRLTPNHPVLTVNGWSPAYLLDEGVQLVSYRSDLGSRSLGVDDDYPPALIEDVLETLRLGGSTIRESRAHYLHGDARWTDGKIDVVGSNGILALDRDAEHIERGREFNFPRTDAGGDQVAIGRLSAGDLDVERIGAAASTSPGGTALALDSRPAEFDLAPLYQLGLGPAAEWDVRLPETARKSPSVNAEFIRELFDRSSDQVAFDEIVEIRYLEFSGHVYDLQTTTGWMIAEGIVISNCRCATGIASAADIKAANTVDTGDEGDDN